MIASKAYALARSLMDENGLTLPTWTFDWMDSRKSFGQCYMRMQFGEFYDCRIRLSMALTELNDEDRVRRTILHEIAHAKANLRLRKSAGHGHAWKREARALGIPPVRCYTEADTVTPEMKWLAVCPAGHTHKRMRRPSGLKSCGYCSPVFSDAHLISYKLNPGYK